MKAVIWRDETLGSEYDVTEIPADLLEKAKEYREKMIEAISRVRRQALREVHRRAWRYERRDPRRYPQGDHRAQDLPGDLRHGVQEQGRADHAGRGRGLPAFAARRSADRRHGRRRSGKDADPPCFGQGAVFGAGVQDHDRPVRRAAGVLPGVLGHAEVRRFGVTTSPRAARSASDACCACTPTSAKRSRRSWPATSARRSG